MSSSPETPQLAERRFRAVNGVALVAFGLSPCAASLGAALLFVCGLTSGVEAIGLGILAVAMTWGFLGSISWVGARGIEATERAVETRKLIKAARSAPEAGQLALEGEAGRLSSPEAPDSDV